MTTSDVYARDGFVITQRELDNAVCELTFDFPAQPRHRAVVRSLALAYLALYRRGVPFVASSPTLRSFAVRREDLGAATHQALVDAVSVVRDHLALLSTNAELYFHDQPEPGRLEPDPRGLLVGHRDGELIGKVFLERFAQDCAGRGVRLP